MTAPPISRRRLIAGAGAGLLLSGCDRLNESSGFRSLLQQAEGLHMRSQRLIGGPDALAREFSPAQMSANHRANGNITAQDAAWRRHLANGFTDWSLKVFGLVERSLALPLSALHALEQRDQITRLDCVEGWSAIGRWQGPRLGTVLDVAGLKPQVRYIVFHCADRFGAVPYYESIDLIDAFHPQTILAWRMNGMALPEAHGAPLRLRVERQLGYKHAKFIMAVEARASLAGLYGGRGGYWEDQSDYAWYAGI